MDEHRLAGAQAGDLLDDEKRGRAVRGHPGEHREVFAADVASPDASEPDTRRRSDRARQAILDAAWALFAQRGLRELTVEAIAARAGVGKATIYRWWPSKAAVVMDAMLEHLRTRIPFPDTGSAREDIRRQLAAVIKLLTSTAAGSAYLALIAESRHDPALATALAERYIAARREMATTVLQRGIDRGELRADLDVDIAIDALYGAVYYRLLVSHDPPDPGYATRLIDQVFGAFTATGASGLMPRAV